MIYPSKFLEYAEMVTWRGEKYVQGADRNPINAESAYFETREEKLHSYVFLPFRRKRVELHGESNRVFWQRGQKLPWVMIQMF